MTESITAQEPLDHTPTPESEKIRRRMLSDIDSYYQK